MRDELASRIAALIDRLGDGSRDDDARDALLREVAHHQAHHVEPFARVLRARRIDPHALPVLADLPGLPTDVFRYTRVAAHDPTEDRRVFRTSGTTQGTRGTHALRDLALYDRAAQTAARYALFPDVERIALVVLAPHEDELPDSSLSYMLARFDAWFGRGPTAWVVREGKVDLDALASTLDRRVREGSPVALLGTSFAFVHAEDGLAATRWQLPKGSRIMQTGGYKGRSREVEPSELRAALAARYGIDEALVVAEYGMTELSSQMYENTLRARFEGRSSNERALWVPGWVRACPVDPERLTPMPHGEVGILRIDDLANLDTMACIQTSDLARETDDGMVLLGRAPGAIPRGCSLTIDDAIGGGAA